MPLCFTIASIRHLVVYLISQRQRLRLRRLSCDTSSRDQQFRWASLLLLRFVSQPKVSSALSTGCVWKENPTETAIRTIPYIQYLLYFNHNVWEIYFLSKTLLLFQARVSYHYLFSHYLFIFTLLQLRGSWIRCLWLFTCRNLFPLLSLTWQPFSFASARFAYFIGLLELLDFGGRLEF